MRFSPGISVPKRASNTNWSLTAILTLTTWPLIPMRTVVVGYIAVSWTVVTLAGFRGRGENFCRQKIGWRLCPPSCALSVCC